MIHQGYQQSVAGRPLHYHSPLPGQRPALLVRAHKTWPPIVWQTEPARHSPETRLTRYVWLAGLGCNLGRAQFRLTVDGLGSLTFHTESDATWSVGGGHGLSLAFHGLLRDIHGDRFGLMLLDVPSATLLPGETLTLRIAPGGAREVGCDQPHDEPSNEPSNEPGNEPGDDPGDPPSNGASDEAGDMTSEAWVMTFEEPLVAGISTQALPLLERHEGASLQPVEVTTLHLGEPAQQVLRLSGGKPVTQKLTFGLNRVRLYLDPAQQPRDLVLDASCAGQTSRHLVNVAPVRPWTISLVQHTHTDIGYTRPQTEILSEHLRYIDYALDYCDATDEFPTASQFRWTCEAAWSVAVYLRTRPPAQVARLARRVSEGRIELTAMPLNMAEVADENLLRLSLAFMAEARRRGLPVPTAMQNDVNGIAWCLIDWFADLNIRYVVMGEHTHRALEPFDHPTPFWWQSPAGARVLAFRADHYMTANFWGVLGEDLDVFGANVVAYLDRLAAQGYPYDEIAVQFSGSITDNAPPSMAASELIRRWNMRYVWPRLRTTTMSAFLERIEQTHGSDLPVHRAAWPDWWTDGFGSAMRETASLRRAQSELIAAQGLLAMATLLGTSVPSELRTQSERVADLLVFAAEHTWGAAESVSDPLCENSMVQWMEKTSYIWQAVMRTRLLQEGALGQLRPHIGQATVPTVAVFNTLNWSRGGLVTFFADHSLLPDNGAFVLRDRAGRVAPLQRLSRRPEGSTWALWSEEVPAFGWKVYRLACGAAARAEPRGQTNAIEGGDERSHDRSHDCHHDCRHNHPSTASRLSAPRHVLENGDYRIEVVPAKGGIVALHDKRLGLDLLDEARQHALGQVIYERLDERASLERRELGSHRRVNWSMLRIVSVEDTPLWHSLRLCGQLEGFEDLSLEIRLYRTAKRVELVYQGRKQRVTEPEGVYVALPFDLPSGHLEFEAQGGAVVPGVDQLPGTASDWNTIQAYAAIRSPHGEIVLVSEDAPLVQFGGINTGRFEYAGRPASNQIFSWVLNNYWVTNFCASQEGELRWKYRITSTSATARGTAARFGWSERIPLVASMLPAAANPVAASAPVTLGLDTPNLLLVAAGPAAEGRAALLHLREIGGEKTTLPERGDADGRIRYRSANAIGEDIEGALFIPPLGTRFLAAERARSGPPL